MFKVPVIQTINTLPDERTEYPSMLRETGYAPMSGQIIDASLVAAPRQRNTNAEKADIKAGRIPEHWRDNLAKLRHKDRDARWTLKFTKAMPHADGTIPTRDLTIPTFGYKNHISIGRRFRLIRAGPNRLNTRRGSISGDLPGCSGVVHGGGRSSLTTKDRPARWATPMHCASRPHPTRRWPRAAM